MREDAAFKVFAKGLAHEGRGGVVIALPVEPAGTGQIKPGLEMLGNGLVQQRALGPAGVIWLGLTADWAGAVAGAQRPAWWLC